MSYPLGPLPVPVVQPVCPPCKVPVCGIPPKGRSLQPFKLFQPPTKQCRMQVEVKAELTVPDLDDSDAESTATATNVSSSSSSSSSVGSSMCTCTSCSSDDATHVMEETKITIKEKKSIPKTKSGSKNKSDETAPGTLSPGGLRKGVGYLYTGTPCTLHIIDGTKIKLDRLVDTDGKPRQFQFRIFTAQDNSTISELIQALGGGERGSLTQIWEWGNGRWKKGSQMKGDEEKAGRRLADLGWTGAGSKSRAPVWLYLEKK